MNIEYRENVLTAEEYLYLERQVGEQITTPEQAKRALEYRLYSISAYDGGKPVGMAYLIGDAAIYWYINDVRVSPEYQGRGIGSEMVRRIIQHVKATAIPGTSISLNLMCAKGKEGFYEKLGFFRRPTQWEGAGMEMEIDVP